MVIIYKYTHINQKDTHYLSETYNKGHHWFISTGINLGIPIKTMKFEGIIPSYLRTGAGSFAVSDKKLANVKQTQNLFEKVKFGIKDMAPTKPISIPTSRKEVQDPNLFRSIQLNMEQKPNLMAFERKEPRVQRQTSRMDNEKQNETDIFIG